MGKSLQIQCVLYGNEKEGLFRSLDSLYQAVINYRKASNNELSNFFVCYGDASKDRIFSETEIEEITNKYKSSFDFKYIFFNFNTGSAKGHNLLGENCMTDYMQIMNPDVIVCPQFFTEIMLPFGNKELNAGMVEARQAPIEHPKEYDINTGETSWATTACAIFPTQLFHKLKGFDNETFFLYCDDLDFSWRLRLLGKKIIYQPSAIVFHAKRLSSDGVWQATPAEIYYSAEAALFMAHKWSNPKLCKKLYDDFSKSGNENLIKAANEYLARKNGGTLPNPLDKDHKVATFVGNFYTEHRFSL